jgi:oligopeptide/dipeptide ABC transporter ATP-binding protein
MADGPLLEVDGIDVSLGRRNAAQILHDVTLTMREGEIVGLIGETGSGKTTLARAVLGLVTPTAGAIRVAGTDTSALRGAQLRAFRRAGDVQFVFQDPLRSLDPSLRVAAIVGEALEVRGEHSAAEIERRVHEALTQVGLDPAMASRHPAHLSGGQRQRVAIARALAGGPRLLICDEPVSALDASSRNQILRLLDELRNRLKLGILVISHDLSSLAGIADRIAVLYRGRILEDGPAELVLTEPHQPYSALLAASAPSVTHRRGFTVEQLRRRDVDAEPAPAGGASACAFIGRCPFATDVCTQAPPLRPDRDGRLVACHHLDTWQASARERGPEPAVEADAPRPVAVGA